MRRARSKVAHSNPAKSRILDRLMASPEQTIRSHRAGNRRFAGRQSRRIPPRPHSRSRFTAMCPARCRSLAPGRGGLPHHAQKASVAPVVGQRGHRCQVGRGPDRLEHPTRSPTLIISASMPLFRTVRRRAKQASASAGSPGPAVTLIPEASLTAAPSVRGGNLDPGQGPPPTTVKTPRQLARIGRFAVERERLPSTPGRAVFISSLTRMRAHGTGASRDRPQPGPAG